MPLCQDIIFFSLPVPSGAEESDSTSRAYFKTRRQRSDSLCLLPLTSLEESGRCSKLTALHVGRKYELFHCFVLFFPCLFVCLVFFHVCFLFLHSIPPDILNLTLRPWQTRTHCCRHIVGDTNVSPFACACNICCGHKFCVRGTKNVSDFVQKHFVSATNVSQFAQPKKHHGKQCVRNNVS